jgi:hypothetical protein
VNDNNGNQNKNSEENTFQNDNEGIHSNKQNHPFEINHSGFYPISCIEFELVGLAICAVLNFQKIHEAEGSNFDLGKRPESLKSFEIFSFSRFWYHHSKSLRWTWCRPLHQ